MPSALPVPADPSADVSSAPLITVASPQWALFASDIHLQEQVDATGQRFLDALDALPQPPGSRNGGASGAALFLLGDLFEAWVGDDLDSEAAEALAARLRTLAGRGWTVYLMHGNRDFLIDVPLATGAHDWPLYSQRCQAQLLPDPAILVVGGERIVLTHGDALCTDDVAYQQWRRQCRDPAWQQQQLALPAPLRRQFAQMARARSRERQENLNVPGGDVNAAAVDSLLDATGASTLVHGHTHRPDLHRWVAAGAPRLRWVLPDWDAGERGRIMSLAEGLATPRQSGTANP